MTQMQRLMTGIWYRVECKPRIKSEGRKSRNTIAMKHNRSENSQVALLGNLFVALDVVADGKVSPAIEADTALGVLAHFGHIFLDILQGGDCAWVTESA